MSFGTLTQLQWGAVGLLAGAAVEIGLGLVKLRSADAATKAIARLVLWMGAATLASGIVLFAVSDEIVAIVVAFGVAAGILATGVMRMVPEMKAIGKRTP
jgi:hypothetical protein